MRHNLCRSFHPWCPGVKNRCLLYSCALVARTAALTRYRYATQPTRDIIRYLMIRHHTGNWDGSQVVCKCCLDMATGHSHLSATTLSLDLWNPQRVLTGYEKLGNYVTWPAWENWNVFLFSWCLYWQRYSAVTDLCLFDWLGVKL